MKIYKKKLITLFALTLMVTSLLLINMNEPTTAQQNEPTYLHGPSLTPIHLNSNKTLTPVHMHYKEGLIEQTPPIGTEWHELHPNYCTDWTLTSFEDVGDPYGELSPNDQIDMIDEHGNVTWFHVDRITYTLNLSWPFPDPTERIFVELKAPTIWDPYMDPYCTLWHEVWSIYSNVYHCIGWIDNGNWIVDFCDTITLNNTKTGVLTQWHVDDVATDLILREKIMDPICTWWHAIYPEEEFCRWYHITSWEDIEPLEEPGHGMLSPGDQIDMIEEESGNKTWYFVDRVTVTLNVSNYYEPSMRMKIELKTWWFEEMFEAFKHPLYSLWHEVYPHYSNVYNLTGWDWLFDDNCNGVLDVCDYIWLQNITHGHIGTEDRWHIDDITYDLILNRKMGDPYCTWWHELYPDCCLYDYHVIGWEDNGDELLSPCDNLTMTVTPGDTTDDYHVENVTLTLNLTVNEPEQGPFTQGERIFIELIDHYETTHYYYAKIDPLSANWMVVCPEDWFGLKLWINSWNDTCNGVLSRCDNITLIDPTGAPFGNCHVDEVAVDMIVKKIGEEPPPPPPTLYWKESYLEYAPSGVPDFDQNQGQWGPTYCAPTAVANSLWWMDSRFHPSSLLSMYSGALGEHDPSNVQPFIQHLAFLMDTDGQRTLLPHLGTWTVDMETGIAQYLSWSGVNPLGDVNGDGTVDNTDYNIAVAANNTTPISVGWDMAADIWPETVTGPYTADNVVNQTDIDLVSAHMGETGQFEEWTILLAPDFYEVAVQVEECEDVILILGFWNYTLQSGWIRIDYPYEEGSGHAVTVAGINSTSLPHLIAISDPDNDAFESGLTPGRSPVPHVHIPPGNTTTHNNASLVSHDIYNVTFGAYPTGTWALQGYVGAPQGYIAVVESAVITSPLPAPDVAVTDVVPWTPYCSVPVSQGYRDWNVNISVTVKNNDITPATFTVSAYANNSLIGTLPVNNLPAGQNTTIVFNWPLTGLPYGYYPIKANATIVGDTNPGNDEYINGQVLVKVFGDVDANGKVDAVDVFSHVALAYGSSFGQPKYDCQCDFDGDGDVDPTDVFSYVAIWYDPTTIYPYP